jgi:outer membrane lipoprotein-sorting protein
MRFGPMIRFICLTLLFVVIPTIAGSQDKLDPENWIKGMEKAYSKIDHYTAIFHKQERIKDNLNQEETIFIKFKKPFKVYMKWIKDPYKGRELLYVDGWNDNQMMVHEGGIMNLLTVSLNPKGSMAMKGNRHPITESGLGKLIKLIGENVSRGIRNDEFALREEGEEVVYGRLTHKLELIFPKDTAKGYYAFRGIVNLDVKSKVPLKVQIYDWNNILIESYGYEDLKINPGLTDVDFNPKNPKYKFY